MIYYDASKEDFLIKIQEGKKIICYGCGNQWKRAVQSLNLYSKLFRMVDNGKKETDIILPNGYIQRFPCYLLNELADEIKAEDTNQYVVLVTSMYWKQIIKDLEKNAVFEKIDIYIWLLMEISGVSYKSMYEQRLILPVTQYYKKLLTFQGIPEEAQRELIRDKEVFMQETDANGEYIHLVLPKIVFFLTTRCTLKCKECTALIPQFPSKIDLDAGRVLEDIKIVLEAVDEVILIQLAGGESLLYPEFEKVLKFLLAHEKVQGVTFVTNATVIPNERILKLLADPKVYITISDYGLLDNLYKIVSLFEKRKIAFELLTDLIWQKVGDTAFRNKEMPQLKFEYLRCGNGMGCKMVENSRLHICDRSARMFMLNKFESSHDYISLLCEADERRSRIRDIFLADYAEACNYCDYANVEAEKIEPAEQIGSPLRKSSYTIVKR